MHSPVHAGQSGGTSPQWEPAGSAGEGRGGEEGSEERGQRVGTGMGSSLMIIVVVGTCMQCRCRQ